MKMKLVGDDPIVAREDASFHASLTTVEKRECGRCHGRGEVMYRPGDEMTCDICNGKGYVWVEVSDE